MKKIKLQSKLHLGKVTIATLSATDQAHVQGGSGLTPCLENSDTRAPMSKLNCVSYFYKCGWVSWLTCVNCTQQGAAMIMDSPEV